MGGDFSSVAGEPRTDLAHVMPDRSLDPTWAPTTNGSVRALAIGSGAVFAGGEFSAADGAPRENLAGFALDTGGLTSFVGGVSAGGPQTLFDPIGVYALLSIGPTLYAVGEFNQAKSGATVATRLRGAAFSVADSQILPWDPGTNRLINGFARDSDGSDLFVGGRFSRVNVDPGAPASTGQLRMPLRRSTRRRARRTPTGSHPSSPPPTCGR